MCVLVLKNIKYDIIYKILLIKFGGFNCALKQACLNMQARSLVHFDVIFTLFDVNEFKEAGWS